MLMENMMFGISIKREKAVTLEIIHLVVLYDMGVTCFMLLLMGIHNFSVGGRLNC